jgi:hypothetical protein
LFNILIEFGVPMKLVRLIKMRPLGRPRCRWVDNIRMDLGEEGWGDVDWIGLAQDRNRRRVLVNSVLNLRVPQNARWPNKWWPLE